MRTKEELDALKSEAAALSEKLAALSDDELTEVIGGAYMFSRTKLLYNLSYLFPGNENMTQDFWKRSDQA